MGHQTSAAGTGAMRLSDRKKDTDSLQCHFHTLTTQPQNVSCKHLLIFWHDPQGVCRAAEEVGPSTYFVTGQIQS